MQIINHRDNVQKNTKKEKNMNEKRNDKESLFEKLMVKLSKSVISASCGSCGNCKLKEHCPSKNSKEYSE
ncbi:hypothetical protein [Methanococcus voltae]|uniref:Endonuclease III n=2 Tax=Methanococcus voltae TaxID=2188 RepID=A0A8J7UQP1_METVO|nr:hypothetical protein [Methanococcus voltae]MBP2172046.1 endonuclease III [Methanococcus voltae]MBP2200998.1 endonuclease III [Methanococcus voltae]MCS3921721.1 endonuclease III [Methanococcus voltae PS]